MTKGQGWIIITELALLLIGLYYAGVKTQNALASYSGPAGAILGDISSLFGGGSGANAAVPVA